MSAQFQNGGLIMSSLTPSSNNNRNITRQGNGVFNDNFLRSFFNSSDFWGIVDFRVDIKEKKERELSA